MWSCWSALLNAVHNVIDVIFLPMLNHLTKQIIVSFLYLREKNPCTNGLSMNCFLMSTTHFLGNPYKYKTWSNYKMKCVRNVLILHWWHIFGRKKVCVFFNFVYGFIKLCKKALFARLLRRAWSDTEKANGLQIVFLENDLDLSTNKNLFLK